MTELLFSSQYWKSKDFRKSCCNLLFLHIRHQLTDNIEGNHQLAITRMQKEHQLEIQDRNNQIQIFNMKTLHCKHKEMVIRPCCKDFRIRYMALLSIVMSPVQMIQVKTKWFWLLRKRSLLKKISFTSIPSISRGYRDGSLPQKSDALEHNIHIIGL